jgi:hypothetical protein
LRLFETASWAVASDEYVAHLLATIRASVLTKGAPRKEVMSMQTTVLPPRRRRSPNDGRAQTGVRIEHRLLKVCKALAALYDISLAEFFEELLRGAFAGRPPLSNAALAQAGELLRIYGLEAGELGAAFIGSSGGGDGQDSPA